MRVSSVIVLVLVCLLLIHEAQASNGNDYKSINIEIKLKSKKSASCIGRIRKSIKKVKGVQSVSVRLKKPISANVSFDPKRVSKEKILSTVRKDRNILLAREIKLSRMIGKIRPYAPPDTPLHIRGSYGLGDYITPREIEDYKTRELLKKRISGPKD